MTGSSCGGGWHQPNNGTALHHLAFAAAGTTRRQQPDHSTVKEHGDPINPFCVVSDLLTMLKRVWGKQEAEWYALREFELYSVMQFLARTNSRRFDSTDQACGR
jgi:hypothetical protein